LLKILVDFLLKIIVDFVVAVAAAVAAQYLNDRLHQVQGHKPPRGESRRRGIWVGLGLLPLLLLAGYTTVSLVETPAKLLVTLLVATTFTMAVAFLYERRREAHSGKVTLPIASLRRTFLWTLFVLALLIVSDFTPVRLGETVAVWVLGPPEAEKLMAALWDDCRQHRWSEAVPHADSIIRRFHKIGEKTEHNLELQKAPLPSEGHAGPFETIRIMKRDPLNLLATSYWIQGQAFEQLKQPQEGPNGVLQLHRTQVCE
jgi:hypothetical protein